MGTYYAWVCDERREYFDPIDLPRYGNKFGAIPHSAWGVGVLALRRWSGCSIRLLSDNTDEYYELLGETEGTYANVTAWTLAAAVHANAIPESGVRFIAREVVGEVEARTAPIETLEARLRETFPDPDVT